MGDALTLLALLEELGAARPELHRSDGVIAVAVVRLYDGRRPLAVEPTCRPGIRVVFDPTDEELQKAATGGRWDIWGFPRAALLDGLAGDPFTLDPSAALRRG